MSLEFRCPNCGKKDLEVIEKDVIMTSFVVEIDNEYDFEYDLIDTGGGYVEHFQCLDCGYLLKDEDEQVIKTEEEVVEWIRKSCSQ